MDWTQNLNTLFETGQIDLDAIMSPTEFVRRLAQNEDNLFSANHRNAMIARHGFSEAEFLTIEDMLDF